MTFPPVGYLYVQLPPWSLMYATGLGELWMDFGSTSKLFQSGCRCTTNGMIYQQNPCGVRFSDNILFTLPQVNLFSSLTGEEKVHAQN
uniref:Uncharacterized protein n=1 Tax=Melopsittacus undulatus TaxID=13146 RepID=A0A8V5GGI2_MELUD